MSVEEKSRVRLDLFDKGIRFERGAGRVKVGLWYLVKVFFFLSAIPYPSPIKVSLLKIFGAKIGKGLVLKPRVNIHFPWKLVIGDDVWIGEEVFILNFENLKIGNNVCISQRAFICGGNHNFRDPAFSYRNGEIHLGDGVWVGASCFVGPGVSIGVDSVVTAGSVVSSSLTPNGVFRGNPALYVKDRWAQ